METSLYLPIVLIVGGIIFLIRAVLPLVVG